MCKLCFVSTHLTAVALLLDEENTWWLATFDNSIYDSKMKDILFDLFISASFIQSDSNDVLLEMESLQGYVEPQRASILRPAWIKARSMPL